MRTVTSSNFESPRPLTGRERPANIVGDGFGLELPPQHEEAEGSSPSQNAGHRHAFIAQRTERTVSTRLVGGSNPSGGAGGTISAIPSRQETGETNWTLSVAGGVPGFVSIP